MTAHPKAIRVDGQASEHALPFRHCEASDVFTVTEGEEGADIVDAANEYLKIFAAPAVNADGKSACFHCGEMFGGLLANIGYGVGIEWGFAHGEGTCSKCRWPYRGMHYAKMSDGSDLFTLRNLFLAYHPDGVSTRGKAS